MSRVRTTIVLPEEDIRLIKMLAAAQGITMSDVIQHGIRAMPPRIKKKRKGGWRAVVGSLNLGGKEPPSRQELYDRYLKEKLSR